MMRGADPQPRAWTSRRGPPGVGEERGGSWETAPGPIQTHPYRLGSLSCSRAGTRWRGRASHPPAWGASCLQGYLHSSQGLPDCLAPASGRGQ